MVKFSEKYVSGKAKIDFSATEHKPGTDEKIEILSQRYDQGLPFWHLDDEHILNHHESKQSRNL